MGISGTDHAPLYALANVARAGAARSGYVSPKVFVAVGGVQYATARAVDANLVLHDSLTIEEVLNDIPNTCAFTMRGAEPSEGAEVVITLGSINNGDRQFAGTILNRSHTYAGTPANWAASINAIDYTWLLTRRQFSGSYTNTSATDIANDIIAVVPGVTSGVTAGLAVLDTFSATDVDALSALTQLAKRIGGYCDVDYHKVVKLFITDETVTNPVGLTSSHRTLTDFSYTRDLGPVRTRMFVEGGGVTTLAPCAVGDTIIPVDTTAWYESGGGVVKSGPQHVTYTGTTEGGGGSLVGPGLSPDTPLVASPASGVGVTAGVHEYAFTFVTASGESLPSTSTAITTGTADYVPPTALGHGAVIGAGVLGVGTYQWGYTVVDGAGETPVSPILSVFLAGTNLQVPLTGIGVGPGGTTSRKIYRTVANGTQLKLVTTIADNVTTTYSDATVTDGALGVNLPITYAGQVALSSIALGPAGVTGRKVYRTTAGGTQLKLQQTITNNTATNGVTDATADGSLGANIPTGDTSGLSFVAPTGGVFHTGSPVVFSTNGAATLATSSAPVFTSASYTFVAADVGAFVYIKSGTNWITGWYEIVSVAAGAATLDASCASVASPTNATWGVDYSESATARVSYTDLAIDATTATKFTSAAFPVAVNIIGNDLVIIDGLGFITQRVVVISVSGTTATCDKVLGTLSSTGGIGTLGLAPADPSVAIGATSMTLASTAAFVTTGGVAIVGNGRQVIRYTGITANRLTGIPSTGAGSVTATVAFNSTVTAAPALIGIPASGDGSILYAILQGDPVNLFVQVDDLAAQATLAALIGGGDDGIVEGFLQDGTIGHAEAAARGAAQLALSSTARVTIRYRTRDVNSRAGRTISVSLGSPTSVTADFTIQRVTIDAFQPALYPTFTVEASSSRVSLEDLLRLIRNRSGA